MALSLEPLDGLHAEQAHGTMRPAVDRDLAVLVALEAVPDRPKLYRLGSLGTPPAETLTCRTRPVARCVPGKLWRRSRVVGQLHDVQPARLDRARDAPASVSGRSQTSSVGCTTSSFMWPANRLTGLTCPGPHAHE